MALGDKKITGPMPELEVDLTTCERGAPCEFAIKPGLPRVFTCRIHTIRVFLQALGWVEEPPPPPKAAA